MIAFIFKRGRLFSGKLRMPWETGLPKVIALETTDRREARRALDEIVKERFAEHRGEIAPRSMRETLEKPLNDLLAAYLADLRAKGRAEMTIAKYQSNIETLASACSWSNLRCVSPQGFCAWRGKSKCSPKSLNDTLANMSGFLRWLVRQKLLKENPLEGVDRVDTRLVERFRRALSEEEQRRLLAVTPHFRAVIYLLIFETGARRKEINELRVGNLFLDSPAPFMRLPASITKNRKEAVMYLRPHVVAALRSILPDNSFPFEYPFRNRVPRISTIVRDLKRAGIVFETEQGRIDLHAMRVTYCTNLLNAGVHPRVVQELMRHSDIKLTMKNYTDPSQLPLAAAVEKLPALTLRNSGQKECAQICAHGAVATGQGRAQADTTGRGGEILQSG